MTKNDIRRFIEQIDDKLAELRRAVEQLPDPVEGNQADALSAHGTANTISVKSPAVRFIDKANVRPAVAKSYWEMGIRAQPIGAENVQEMIAACGVQPEDNTFSRGIIEMRGE